MEDLKAVQGAPPYSLSGLGGYRRSHAVFESPKEALDCKAHIRLVRGGEMVEDMEAARNQSMTALWCDSRGRARHLEMPTRYHHNKLGRKNYKAESLARKNN